MKTLSKSIDDKDLARAKENLKVNLSISMDHPHERVEEVAKGVKYALLLYFYFCLIIDK